MKRIRDFHPVGSHPGRFGDSHRFTRRRDAGRKQPASRNRFIPSGEEFGPRQRDDEMLLQSWWKEEPPAYPETCDDVAFRCGASDAFTPNVAPDPPRGVREFTVATWNARELVVHGKKLPGFTQKADALKQMNADIVALQEVGDLKTLNLFRNAFVGKKAYPYEVLVRGNDGINVALISRFPIKRVYTYRDHPVPIRDGGTTRFERDLLEAVIQVAPHFPLKVFVTHLKSQRGGKEAESQREAESREVQRIVAGHIDADPSEKIAVVGDLNDTPESPTVKNLRDDPDVLTDPLADEGREYQPTHRSRKYGDERLDYILLSPALSKHYVSGSAAAFRLQGGKRSQPPSDHDPLLARFRV